MAVSPPGQVQWPTTNQIPQILVFKPMPIITQGPIAPLTCLALYKSSIIHQATVVLNKRSPVGCTSNIMSYCCSVIRPLTPFASLLDSRAESAQCMNSILGNLPMPSSCFCSSAESSAPPVLCTHPVEISITKHQPNQFNARPTPRNMQH